MQRFEVIQNILNLFSEPAYLEVGVQDGLTFHHLMAARKVAVDPVFRFDINDAKRQPVNATASYYPLSSDDYFATEGAGEAFDVIYLDGLHTFDQTLRDLINAVGVLSAGGVIILDDTVPSSYGASIKDEADSVHYRMVREPEERAWMGDVYRLVFFLKDYFSQLSFATLSENHGQTVVWREQRAAPNSPRLIGDIAQLDFASMVINYADFNVRPFGEIIEHLRQLKR